MSLPGWPREQSDQIPTLHASHSDRSDWSVLPTVSEVAGGAPFAPSRSAADRHVAGQLGDKVRTLSPWRPLSIAPSMTEGVLLALAEYAALFFSDLFAQQHAFRVFSGVTAFMIVCALLLSLSRAAWVATAIAVAVLFALSGKMAEAARPSVPSPERWKLLRPICVMVFAAIALSLLFIGPRGRRQVDVRLHGSVQSDRAL